MFFNIFQFKYIHPLPCNQSTRSAFRIQCLLGSNSEHWFAVWNNAFTSTMHSFLGVWNRSETMWQRQFMPTRPTKRPVRTSNPRRQRGATWATLQETRPCEKVCPGNQKASTRWARSMMAPNVCRSAKIHYIIFLVPLCHDIKVR